MARTTNWCIASWPTTGWAQQVYPSLEPAEALERLRRELAHVSRLDEPDPADGVASTGRGAAGRGRPAHRAGLRRDPLQRAGHRPDRGALPERRLARRLARADRRPREHRQHPDGGGLHHPRSGRVEGVVRATKPLELAGSLIDGIEIRFEGGRAVQIDAATNADVLRAVAAKDDGAARLGELALVDGSGRIGRARDRLLEHPARRERREPHRARQRLYDVRGRGRGRARACEPERRSTSTS